MRPIARTSLVRTDSLLAATGDAFPMHGSATEKTTAATTRTKANFAKRKRAPTFRYEPMLLSWTILQLHRKLHRDYN